MKIAVVYHSASGNTKKQAELVAEGAQSVPGIEVKTISIDNPDISWINESRAVIFGSPTYHRDMAEPMKTFLFLAKKANLESKLAGAFGSYTHSGDAPCIIFDTMQYVYKMEPFDLGSFNLKEAVIETAEGMRACQDYGKVFGEKLAA